MNTRDIDELWPFFRFTSLVFFITKLNTQTKLTEADQFWADACARENHNFLIFVFEIGELDISGELILIWPFSIGD